MSSDDQKKNDSSVSHVTHINEAKGPIHTGSGDIYAGQVPGDNDSAESDSSMEDGLESKRVIKILFLAANPKDTGQLRLDEEIRSIDEALRQAEFRDRFDLRQHFAVRVRDIQGLLLRHQPDIVHFSGHGNPYSEIILEDAEGYGQPVPAHALSRLFSVLKDNIRCVVLNACFSEVQAKAIAQHIDSVVGMTKAVGDPSAVSFASSFYQAIGYGRDIQTAFELGCLEIDLESLMDKDVPKLIAERKDPKDIFILHPES